MSDMSTAATRKPYAVRKATALYGAPARLFDTEAAAAAIADARQISADQGGTEWLVQGPTGTKTIRHTHGRRPTRCN